MKNEDSMTYLFEYQKSIVEEIEAVEKRLKNLRLDLEAVSAEIISRIRGENNG